MRNKYGLSSIEVEGNGRCVFSKPFDTMSMVAFSIALRSLHHFSGALAWIDDGTRTLGFGYVRGCRLENSTVDLYITFLFLSLVLPSVSIPISLTS
jgi:hypothetical protein